MIRQRVQRHILCLLVATGVCATANVAWAQSEQHLRQAFEGQYVVVRMEMPATQLGVDLYPFRQPAIDFRQYSQRIKQYGVALREGERVLVTTVHVKRKNIEFQLGGGGYGTFGDDSGSVYVPSVDKSQREKDLERSIKSEIDYERRRRLERQLDDERRDREREQRDRDMQRRVLEERKKSEIADRRLGAGSRVNIWFAEGQLDASVPTPDQLRQMLHDLIDFGERGGALMRPERPAPYDGGPGTPPARRSLDNANALRRGLIEDEVHDLLGRPTRSKDGQQGQLTTRTEWYEQGERVVEVTYVAGVVVSFAIVSR